MDDTRNGRALAPGNDRAAARTSAAPEDRGDLGIRIDRNGRWYYHGSPIDRKEMVCLFATLLTRAEDGTFWLITPHERGWITVEDAPFVAVELYACGCGRDMTVSFRTNVDELVTVDHAHPLWIRDDPTSGDPVPYVHLRDGIEARLARSVYYDLVAHGFEEKVGDDPLYGVWSKGLFFPLGRLTEPG
jgi:uncharacterized protein